MTELPKSFEKELPNLASQELLVRWKQGDAQAANLLVERYSARLVALVASRLNHRYRRAISPEDLVQSAMGSFFGMVSDCRMQASRIHSVWSLLATIAKRKMLRAIERENTVKRGAHLNRLSLDDNLLVLADPKTEAADQLHELLVQILDSKDERTVAILGGMLEGRSQREIAEELGLSERTIRRALEDIRHRLSEAAGIECQSTDESTQQKPGLTDPKTLPRWNYGQFVLRRMIGQGTFGKVYQAVTQVDGTEIAVKFLKRELWENIKTRSLFLREVDHASRVIHPNVVRYLGWGTSPHGGPFILQQYIDGKPLSQRRKDCQSVNSSEESFRACLLQICDALHAIHFQNMIHGDLTPNNILVDSSNRVFLTDFGFSRTFDAAPQVVEPAGDSRSMSWKEASTIAGTFGFLAPEQLSPSFGTIGPATDIFALGAIAYWYAFGQPPFCRSMTADSCIALLADAPIELPNAAHQWLHPLIVGCLKKSGCQRPQSMDEVRALITMIHVRQ